MMISTVTLYTVILSIVIFIAMYFIGIRDTAFSVLIGCSITLVNYILLSYGISKLLEAKPVAIFFNSVRLMFFIALMSALIYFKLANVVGLFTGFTVTIVTIAAVGLILSRRTVNG